jgi:sugar lactone lactonase YvrE
MWRRRVTARLLVLALLASGDAGLNVNVRLGGGGLSLLSLFSSSSSSLFTLAQQETAPVGSGAAEWHVSTAAGDHAGGYQDGNASTSLFSRPQGIALDSSRGLVYISDAWNHRIRVFDAEQGTVSTLAGTGEAGHADGPGLTAARFNFPRGLALSLDARTLYVADGDNHRVRSVDVSTGDARTLCGSGSIGRADGRPSEGGALYYPSGLATSHTGHYLYVADTWNCRVRAVDLRPGLDLGKLYTVAGKGACGHKDGSRADGRGYHLLTIVHVFKPYLSCFNLFTATLMAAIKPQVKQLNVSTV